MESEKQDKGAPDTTELGGEDIKPEVFYYNFCGVKIPCPKGSEMAFVVEKMSTERKVDIMYSVLELYSKKIKRLERIYEKLYHEIELYNIYLPRITDVLIKYFPAMDKYRKEIDIMMRIHKGFLENIESALQEHFQYHSHTDKKTKKRQYKEYE